LARNRVNDVSTVVASFIDFLIANGFTTHSQVSVIGHSLGDNWNALMGSETNMIEFQVRTLLVSLARRSQVEEFNQSLD
jgi:hypothetical protein